MLNAPLQRSNFHSVPGVGTVTTWRYAQRDLVATIPTSPNYPALNVSHAAAILFYEIYRSLGQPATTRMRRASEKEKQVLLKCVDRMVEFSGLPEHRKRASKLVFKRLVNRAFISGRECHTLIGLVKVLAQHGES